MLYLILSVIIVSIIVGIPYGNRYHKTRLAIKRKRFEGRESLAMDDIYNKFYSDSNLRKAQVIEEWLFVAESLDLDPSRLRPTDKFKGELGPVKGYYCPSEFDDLDEKVYIKKKEFNTASKKLSFDTLDDYIRFICREN